MKDRSLPRCECGCTIFYLEVIDGQFRRVCVNINCNKIHPARRKDDRELPKIGELKNDWL